MKIDSEFICMRITQLKLTSCGKGCSLLAFHCAAVVRCAGRPQTAHTWLRERLRQVKTEVVSNKRDHFHQTMCEPFAARAPSMKEVSFMYQSKTKSLRFREAFLGIEMSQARLQGVGVDPALERDVVHPPSREKEGERERDGEILFGERL